MPASDEEFDLDLAAASLRADRRDLDGYLAGLATRLENALPERTRVERRRRGLFDSHKLVRRIDVGLGDSSFALTHEGGRVECRREVVVRGVRIKGEELDLDAWIAALTRELADEARTSSGAREALGRLLEQ